MNWYYAQANQPVGPISEARLVELATAGVVKPETLVWREGMANWQPFREATLTPPAATPVIPPVFGSGDPAASAASGGEQSRCIECGQFFPASKLIRFGDCQVCANCKPNFVRRLQQGASASAAMNYAGFWIRFLAKIIDGLILGVPFAILAVALFLPYLKGQNWRPERLDFMMGVPLMLQLVFQLSYWFVAGIYNTLFIGKFGATPGKMALQIRVVRADGTNLSYAHAAGRFFAEILSSICCKIGYIIAAFDPEKRALHDHICSTRVVRK
ncbi:MAG: RDD family protein [Verrucomicrobia bacterium]|nr:RDD family protein [Verrucomicrobiota bacterium]